MKKKAKPLKAPKKKNSVMARAKIAEIQQKELGRHPYTTGILKEKKKEIW